MCYLVMGHLDSEDDVFSLANKRGENKRSVNGSRRDKTCLRGFGQSETKTSTLRYID